MKRNERYMDKSALRALFFRGAFLRPREKQGKHDGGGDAFDENMEMKRKKRKRAGDDPLKFSLNSTFQRSESDASPN